LSSIDRVQSATASKGRSLFYIICKNTAKQYLCGVGTPEVQETWVSKIANAKNGNYFQKHGLYRIKPKTPVSHVKNRMQGNGRRNSDNDIPKYKLKCEYGRLPANTKRASVAIVSTPGRSRKRRPSRPEGMNKKNRINKGARASSGSGHSAKHRRKASRERQQKKNNNNFIHKLPPSSGPSNVNSLQTPLPPSPKLSLPKRPQSLPVGPSISDMFASIDEDEDEERRARLDEDYSSLPSRGRSESVYSGYADLPADAAGLMAGPKVSAGSIDGYASLPSRKGITKEMFITSYSPLPTSSPRPKIVDETYSVLPITNENSLKVL